MLSPLESAEGILVTAAIRDISVRKAAEKHLAQMEGRYRGLLEAAPDAMVVVNQGGEIVLLNVQAENQFGYRRDELLGQKVKNIIPEGFAERLIADALRSTEDALAQQIGTGIELIARRKDGSEFPIELMLSPLESAEGILVTAAIRDITARKKAEAHLLQNVEELNRSNEELGQFAYIASHDLQEPLRMVASYTQLLSRRYKGKLDSDADEFIAFAVDGASRMQRLIQDLLAYSRVGTKGKDLLETSSEDALQQALVESARHHRGKRRAGDARSPAHRAGGRDATDSAVSEPRRQCHQVPKAPEFPTCTSPPPRTAGRNGFSVKDNGLGIDPQYFERIFGMFQRLHKREEFAGTGIGLAICKKIVERHGGNISVESQPGQGSTFRFALPGSGDESQKLIGDNGMPIRNSFGRRQSRRCPADAGSLPRRQFVYPFARGHRWRGGHGLSETRGRPTANAPRPDLILLDLNLPKMDGREVLAHIKEDSSLKSIPTVILTTSEAEVDIVKSYQLQANCYLSKPVQLDAFENLVKSINDFWLTKAKLPPRANFA